MIKFQFKLWQVPLLFVFTAMACALPGSSSDDIPPTFVVQVEVEAGAPTETIAAEEVAELDATDLPTDTPSAPDTADTPATDTPTAPSPTETVAAVEVIAPKPNINTAFILDASGSMLNALDGRTRWAVAQDAIVTLSGSLPPQRNTSLWAYGHRVPQDDMEASCQDIEEVILMSPVDPAVFDSVVHGLDAKGYTPITTALTMVAASFPVGPDERNAIVLVSDGEETCGGDPCALAAELKARDIELRINTIGYASDAATRMQLQCIATVTGGIYRDANDAAELEAALEEAAEEATVDPVDVAHGLGGFWSIVLSPDGRNLYAAAARNDALATFTRDPASGLLSFVRAEFNHTGFVGMNKPLWVTISPDGRHVYVTAADDNSVVIFSRAADTGVLTFVNTHEPFLDNPGVDLAEGIAVSPDGGNVYVLGADNAGEEDVLAVLRRAADTGLLTPLQLLQNGQDGVDGFSGLTAVVVSPDGKSVYASSRNTPLAAFIRAADTGALSFAGLADVSSAPDPDTRLWDGIKIIVAPDNSHVYTTGRRASSLTPFARNMDTSQLTRLDAFVQSPDSSGINGLAISPDGQHIYAATDSSDSVLTLSRDAGTGLVTHLQTLTDDTDGVDGIRAGVSVAVSADGAHVYVAGRDDANESDGSTVTLAMFARDPASGLLTFMGAK